MKKQWLCIDVLCCMVALFFATQSFSQQMDGFQFPSQQAPGQGNWTVGCNPFWGTCVKAWHTGEDASGNAGDPVYAPARGVVKHTGVRTGYGNVIVIEHNINGEVVCSVLGHLRSAGLAVTVGQTVNRGDPLGELGTSVENGGWSPHYHFGINKGPYRGDYAGGCSAGSWWYGGYTKCLTEQGLWYDPSSFVNSHPVLVGHYASGWLDANHSQKFLDAYFADGTLGNPFDNGGGVFVHWWSDQGQYPLVGVWLQDFHNPTTNQYSALIRNPNGNVYAVKGPFRDWYTDPAHFGYKELGAPKGKEQQESSNIVQEFENGALTRPVASSTVSQEYLVRLAVNNMYAPVQLSATNFTQTSITLAWKDGVNPSGTTYKIYRNNAYVVSSGTNLYFSDSGLSPNTMYQYKVSALYNNEESIFSNTVIVGMTIVVYFCIF